MVPIPPIFAVINVTSAAAVVATVTRKVAVEAVAAEDNDGVPLTFTLVAEIRAGIPKRQHIMRMRCGIDDGRKRGPRMRHSSDLIAVLSV